MRYQEPQIKIDEMWIAYLNKVETLTSKERDVFIDTVILLSNPPIIINTEDLS